MSHLNSDLTNFGAELPTIDSRDYQRLASRRWRPTTTPSVEDNLFERGHEFDFFQAVSLLESIYPDRQPVGMAGGHAPTVRFAAHSSSSSFAASPIYEILPATETSPVARMTIGFMGLTGPSGVLPQHYTELLQRIEFEARGPHKYALRDWFDLFNDRLVAMFYRSWKKYRPFATYAKAMQGESDSFTTVLQSVAGWGLPGQTSQVHMFVPKRRPLDESTVLPSSEKSNPNQPSSSTPSDRTERAPLELALLRYAALFAQRPRCASNLQNLLEDYFSLPITVQQFHGNWLSLDETAQTRLGVVGGNSILGQNAVAGDQTWERQNKILICVGPLENKSFERMLPNYESEYENNDYALMTELVRLFAGPEVEFDIQLSIRPESIPAATIDSDANSGLRLGWNSWLSGDHSSDIISDTCLSCD